MINFLKKNQVNKNVLNNNLLNNQADFFCIQKFNSTTHYKKNKWLKIFIIIFVAIIFLFLVMALAAVNIRYSNNSKYNFSDLFYIFNSSNIFENNNLQIKNVNASTGLTFGANAFIDLLPIRKAVWVSVATIIAGVGLTLAGVFSQGLTKNPLADPTTLGATEASVFGAILMNVLVGAIVGNDVYQYIFVSFAFLGGGISVIFIFMLIKLSKNNLDYLKITLAGLAISIFFRTINYLLRMSNSVAVRTSASLAIGGAENTYSLYPSQQTILFLGIGLILFSLILSLIFARHLTLLELGDEKATGLGINVALVKVVGLIIILIVVPISISLVGNVAFVGLFAPHVIRILFKTRNYMIVIPLGILLGSLVMSFGLTLNILYPAIPSSIYLVFIGAPMLIYLGWTRKQRNN